MEPGFLDADLPDPLWHRPDAEAAAIALLPAILGFVVGALVGGWLIDRLRKKSSRAPVWVALIAMSGGLVMALVVFKLFNLAGLMTAAFFLGLIAYMVMPAVNIIMFRVVTPETSFKVRMASARFTTPSPVTTTPSPPVPPKYVPQRKVPVELNLTRCMSWPPALVVWYAPTETGASSESEFDSR